MVTRKVSTGTATRPTVINLEEDEQLVEEVTTIKKTGRQRRPKPADDEPITVEPIVDDDDDDPADDGDLPFSDSSLAAIIYGDDTSDASDEFCNVNVRRYPDSMNDNFIVPCTEKTHLPRIANVPLSTDKEDIEARVRSEYGGGHYHFQIFYNGRLGKSWQATFQDTPEHRRRAEFAANPTPVETAPAAPAAPVDPMVSLINNLEQTARLRTLLFGDTEKQYKDEIERLRAEAANRPELPPAVPQSETLLILEKALATTSPDVQERLLDYAFPANDSGSRHWIAELADVALKNRDTIGGLLGSLLRGVPAPTATQPSIVDMMRGPAPGALPATERPSVRRKPEPPPVDAASEIVPTPEVIHTPPTPERIRDLSEFADDIAADDETATDATAKDAEIIDEVKNEPAKPKRGGKATVI